MKTLFAKYNNERLPKYQIVTKIVKDEDGIRYALKEPLFDDAKEHIETIYKNYELLKSSYDIDLVKPKKVENGLLFEMAEGKSLENILLECLDNSDSKQFQKYINKFLDFVDAMVSKRNVEFEQSEEFENIFGKWEIDETQDIIKVANIDMIFSNIFVNKEDKFTLIDYEWVFDFEVPKSYIVWRSFYPFYVHHIQTKNNDNIKFMNIIEKKFIVNEEKFYNYTFGENRKYFLNSKVLKSISNLEDIKEKNNHFNQIFIDSGSNYNEKESIKKAFDIQIVEFDLSTQRNIKALRFDPLNDYCIVKIHKILINDNFEVKSFTSNAFYNEDNIYYFNTNDSQIYLDINNFESIAKITFDLKYLYIGEDAINQSSNIFTKILEQKDQNIQNKGLDIAIIKQRLKLYHFDNYNEVLKDLGNHE